MTTLHTESTTVSVTDATKRNPPQQPPLGLFTPKGKRRGDREAIFRPSVSYWTDAWTRIKKNRLALLSAAYIVFICITVVVGPWIVPYTHYDQENWNQNQSPSLGLEALVVESNTNTYEEIQVEVPSNTDGSSTDNTSFSSEDSQSQDATSFDPPPSPTSIELMGEPLTTGVAFKWPPVPGAEGYRVYRSINPGTDGVPQGDIPQNIVSYQDQGEIIGGDTYFYTVYAYNSMGDSATGAKINVVPKLALSLDDALKIDPSATLGGTIKTGAHLLGTDHLGRDLLSRLLNGGRVSLFIGIFAPLIFIFIGVLYGAISGYLGGLIDDLMMRLADMVSTVPDLLALIILQVFLGSGLMTLIIALVMVSWARSARQIRGEVLRLREAEFVHAAKILGTNTRKIIFRHLLPNTTGTILVLFTLAVPQAIFTEAFLSYIGLGIKPPLASWGMVVNEGAKNFATYPHQVLAPALLISITMLAFNKLGDGLRDALDPKLRGAD
jgi:oligopeptide transport system permease protein